MNSDIELIDLLDILTFTLSTDFLHKWKHKYGERILRLFQFKVLDSMKKQKPLKLDNVYKFFVKDSGYNPEIVMNFFIDIDYSLYEPILSGDIKTLRFQHEKIISSVLPVARKRR